MQPARSYLSDIERLTTTNCSESRRELLRRLTDLFLVTEEQQSDGDNNVFGTVMQRLAGEVDQPDRAEFAERIADSRSVPRSLARQLGSDGIAVARPILERCETLETEDLVQIAISRSQGHLRAIAVRSGLDQQVTDILAERGDEGVLDTICANAGARFSDHGFSAVIKRGGHSLDVTESLLGRTDVPEDHRNNALRTISRTMETEIAASNLDISDESLQAVIVSPPPSALPPVKYKMEIDRLRDSGQLSENTVSRFARSNHLISVSYVMSLISRLDLRMVHDCLSEGHALPIAVLFRGLAFSRTTMREVLHSSPSPRIKSARFMTEVGGLFATLDQPAATRILRFLRLRCSATPQA